MKTLLILIFIAAISSTSSTVAIGDPSFGKTPDSSVSRVALQGPDSTALRGHRKLTALRTQSNLDGLRGTVVKEMRATKAFVKENVKEESADRGLMLLAAIGMIVLQLRRKHKSLPQRQIAPYA